MTKHSDSPSLVTTFISTLAAFFGVQSEKNRVRDFTQGKISHFILMGLIATLLFILLLSGVVYFVLHLAGQ
jgi:hypothetical protein